MAASSQWDTDDPSYSKTTHTSIPVKRLTWDEMQKWRAQYLCFNCNDRFTAGHKRQESQLLLLEGCTNMGKIICEEIIEDNPCEDKSSASEQHPGRPPKVVSRSGTWGEVSTWGGGIDMCPRWIGSWGEGESCASMGLRKPWLKLVKETRSSLLSKQ